MVVVVVAGTVVVVVVTVTGGRVVTEASVVGGTLVVTGSAEFGVHAAASIPRAMMTRTVRGMKQDHREWFANLVSPIRIDVIVVCLEPSLDAARDRGDDALRTGR